MLSESMPGPGSMPEQFDEELGEEEIGGQDED
jgi:hypothetical protein